VPADTGPEGARWLIHGERAVDENPHIRVSLADVELPDGTEFTQYVFRMRRCVMALVLDDPGTAPGRRRGETDATRRSGSA